MVENKAKNPRAIGLLFADSSTTAIAQPIDEVPSFFSPQWSGNNMRNRVR
jgi:hypothetical protein